MRRTVRPAPWNKLLIGLALVLGLALTLAPVVRSSGGTSGTGRGDNPVVGSLPCIVDPTGLDSRFWIPLGLPGPPSQVSSGLPMLGLIGPPMLGNSVLDAGGTPYGWVNRQTGWTAFGLTQTGYATVSRVTVATSAVVAWQWVPTGYLGGKVIVQGPSGTTGFPIATQSFPLSLAELALLAGNPSATVTIEPPAANAALGKRIIRISTTPGAVRVQYEP